MNGVAERLNRTLQDRATTMLLACGLNKSFWSEAILTANYLKNRSPTNAVGKQFDNSTPAEIWFGKKPDLKHLRIFGSECYNHIPSENRTKLQAKSTKCFFIGYGTSNGSYRLWDETKNKLVMGRNVTFNEDSILKRAKMIDVADSEAEQFKQEINEPDTENDNSSISHGVLEDTGYFRDNTHSIVMDDAGDNNENHDVDMDNIGDDNENELRRSTRTRRQPERYGEWTTYAHYALSAEQFVQNDPITLMEAKKRDDWPKWHEAIQNEYQSLIKNGTWTLCELPKGRNAISCKWVFKIKYKADGQIDKYKARLVARGFS